MIKRLQITLLALFVSVLAMASETSVKNADGVEIWYDFDSSAKTASVTYEGSYYYYKDEYIGNVVIPSKVTYEGEEYSVTEIGDYAFYYCSSLTSITIPKGVTSIGSDAFCNCSSLTSITLPEGLTTIGKSAFEDCSSLTNITIPEGVTSIGERAFSECDSLTSITIPESVKTIGNYAFHYCSSLTSIDVASDNNSYTSIDGVLFSKDKTILIKYPEGKKDVTSYAIPENVTEIRERAFDDCNSLTSITIPESVKEIGKWAFYDCRSLTSIDVALDNNSYTSINGVLFSKDKTILIKHPEGKKDVTSYAIPESVTSIEDEAFYGCSSLTSITIPEGVTEIGDLAFNGCFKLYEIYNKSNLTITVGSNYNGYYVSYAKNVYTDESGESKLHTVGDYIFYVDEDNIELLAYIGDEIAITLPSDYEGKDYIIAGFAFEFCSSLTSIAIPKGVTEIGNWAFSGCSYLTSITIPEGVSEIGVGAFDHCSSLTSITIPESVTSIGDEAFYECSSLTSITIPEGVTEIGEWAFYNCSGLKSIMSMNVTPPSNYDGYMFDGVDKSIPVYVPKQSVEAYKSAEYWKDFTNIQGIDDTPISDIQTSEINVRLIGNTIVVEGTDNYFVYSISGQCLGKVESLERGVYIVVADGVSKKIVVK